MSPWPGAFACVLAALALLGAIATVIEWAIRRRNDNQVRYERRLRNGMREAARRGWLPEDLQ